MHQMMSKQMTQKLASLALLVAAVAVVTTAAVGGTGGTEFDTIVTQLTGWLEGGLGKVLALAALAVGLGIGVIQQSVMAVVVGISMAIAVYFGPGVIDGIITAGLPF